MLENVDIFPYQNENFQVRKQRYILITPVPLYPGLLNKVQLGI